jgi:hypothetical protein
VKTVTLRARVLDCDPELAASIAALFQDRGWATTLCTGLDSACDLIVAGIPAPREVSRRLDPHAPILLLKSASTPYGVLEEWIADRPGFAILDKPVSPEVLLDTARILVSAADRGESLAIRAREA